MLLVWGCGDVFLVLVFGERERRGRSSKRSGGTTKVGGFEVSVVNKFVCVVMMFVIMDFKCCMFCVFLFCIDLSV